MARFCFWFGVINTKQGHDQLTTTYSNCSTFPGRLYRMALLVSDVLGSGSSSKLGSNVVK